MENGINNIYIGCIMSMINLFG